MGEHGSDSAEPFVGRVLKGTYRVARLLGEGGMGAVYAAEHTRLDKRFAIKTLHKQVLANEEAYHRFRREAEIATAIGHPNIVEVIDFDHTEDGVPYLIMEMLDGEDLGARLDRDHTLPLDVAAPIFAELCSALQATHDRGIVHRDLKPQNIFLTRFGERTDFPKILDFGISKIAGSHSVLTQEQSFLGSPYCMAPEQARGQSGQVDARTDIFALGVILYRALGGLYPFQADSIPGLLYQIVHEEPPALSSVQPSLPKAVSDVIVRALSKPPEQRFSGARELAAALSRALGVEARTARTGEVALDVPATAPAPPVAAPPPDPRGSTADPIPLEPKQTTPRIAQAITVEQPRQRTREALPVLDLATLPPERSPGGGPTTHLVAIALVVLLGGGAFWLWKSHASRPPTQQRPTPATPDAAPRQPKIASPVARVDAGRPFVDAPARPHVQAKAPSSPRGAGGAPSRRRPPKRPAIASKAPKRPEPKPTPVATPTLPPLPKVGAALPPTKKPTPKPPKNIKFGAGTAGFDD